MKGSFKVKGYVHKINEPREWTKFKKRDFILRMERRHNKQDFIDHIKFELINERCDMIDQFALEEFVEVEFFIRGKMWQKPEGEELNFTTLQVWNINTATGRKKKDDTQTALKAEGEAAEVEVEEYDDDLPF